jgi:hypothetical protein
LAAAADPRTQVPIPYDLYPSGEAIDPESSLSASQEAFILSACPAGSRILGARFMRDERLPCPVRIQVAIPDHGEQTLVLRMDRMSRRRR